MKEVTLEMSLKPFKQLDDDFIISICKDLFRQWTPIIKKADGVAILLWIGDGSEILDYTGDITKSFEWGKYIGRANECKEDWKKEKDPLKLSPHAQRYLYTEKPMTFTYADLKRIIYLLKKTGNALTNKRIRIGATFDPGPEFSESDFKYKRHPEICTAGTMGEKSFVVSYENLHKDQYPYCAYPEGIPEGLSFATFLGAQTQCFLDDMNMDYIWLSNGFGFGAENWATTGPLFDGKTFSQDKNKIEDIKNKTLKFWKDFRLKCPNYEVQTRGTNLSIGIDFATDGVATKEIYNGNFNLLPPPNSPWAALDKNFGLEIIGYLSRIAQLPKDKGYMFRYYLHDPWWMNSPWFDRYEGQPHDIYLPLALSRINEKGGIDQPDYFNVLTVDTSLGELPEIAVSTVMPHLLQGFDHFPDRISPFLWVYPFDEYQSVDHDDLECLKKSFFEDWFMIGAVNQGFPISSVVSTKECVSLLQKNNNFASEAILITPVPKKDTEWEKVLLNEIQKGRNIILYGSLTFASEQLKRVFHISCTTPIDKDIMVKNHILDHYKNEIYSSRMYHDSELSNGGIDTILNEEHEDVQVITSATKGKEERVLSVYRKCNNGKVVWIRGTNNHYVKDGNQLLQADLLTDAFSTSAQLRHILSLFNYDIHFHYTNTKNIHAPIILVHRHSNAFYFSGYLQDVTVECRLHFPLGVPVLIGHEVNIQNGIGIYHFPRAFHKECRVFVEQETGTISMSEYGPVSVIMERRVLLEGLQNATVYIFPENNEPQKCELLLNSSKPHSIGEQLDYEIVETPWGMALKAVDVTGKIMISTEFQHSNYLERGKNI